MYSFRYFHPLETNVCLFNFNLLSVNFRFPARIVPVSDYQKAPPRSTGYSSINPAPPLFPVVYYPVAPIPVNRSCNYRFRPRIKVFNFQYCCRLIIIYYSLGPDDKKPFVCTSRIFQNQCSSLPIDFFPPRLHQFFCLRRMIQIRFFIPSASQYFRFTLPSSEYLPAALNTGWFSAR